MAYLRSKAAISTGLAALGLGLFALANEPGPGAGAVEPASPSDLVQLPHPTRGQLPAELVQPTSAPPQPAGERSGAVAAGDRAAPVMDPYAG